MIAALVWAVALPLSASSTIDNGSRMRSWTVASVYRLGAVVCHQRPERSYSTAGRIWPVCARCSGIYFGAALVALAGLLGGRRAGTGLLDAVNARSALAIGVAPSAATLIWEWTTGQAPGNTVRLLAGAPIGVAVMGVLVSAADGALRPS
jgi:hypothetical protein